VIGIQSYTQLAKVYGHEGAREISSLLNTRFIFRVPDPEMTQWSAKNLGETTSEEVREGISYEANSIRDAQMLLNRNENRHEFNENHCLALRNLVNYRNFSINDALAEIDGLSRNQAGGINEGLSRNDVIHLSNFWHIAALIKLKNLNSKLLLPTTL
jgi:Type IV secretion-system coupling protein DNA-binding domain